jgi:hypothetical protein
VCSHCLLPHCGDFVNEGRKVTAGEKEKKKKERRRRCSSHGPRNEKGRKFKAKGNVIKKSYFHSLLLGPIIISVLLKKF